MSAATTGGDPLSEDLELARRCADGDRNAQRRLFRDHRHKVHGTLFRILGSNQEMEDLIQEAFMEVFRSIGSFRGDAKLTTWVARITTRVAFAHISRRKTRDASLEVLPETPDGGPSAEQHAVAREATKRLYAALDRIDAKHRVAFALHVLDGRPLKEVAELTDCSLVATKSRVWRARRELRKRAGKDPLLRTFIEEGDEGKEGSR